MQKKKRLRDKFATRKTTLPIKTHSFLWYAFRAGCYIEHLLRQTHLKAQQTHVSFLVATQYVREKAARIFRAEAREIIANESTVDRDTPTYLARFDSDSYRIGIYTLCTRTLSGNKNRFQDLQLYKGKSVTGIAGGLEIAGEGTFVFRIEDNEGHVDTIKIPHSSHVLGLKLPLLSPQHWAETAKDNYSIKYETKIEADEDGCTLLWRQKTRQKRVHYDPLTNTPIFRTAPGFIQYQASEATFMACDASHLRHHIWMDMNRLQGDVDLDPTEFIAEEDINRLDDRSKASEGVDCDDKTVKTSNV